MKSDDHEMVQLFFPELPIRNDAVQQIVKRPPVVMMAEMTEFVKNHVIDAGDGQLGQPDVENDAAVPPVASPAPLHHPERNRRRSRAGGRPSSTLGSQGETVGQSYTTGFARSQEKTQVHSLAKQPFGPGPKPDPGSGRVRPGQPLASPDSFARPENPGRFRGDEGQNLVEPGPGGGMNTNPAVRTDFETQAAADSPDPEKFDGLRAAFQLVQSRRGEARFFSAEHPGHHTRERALVAIPGRS